MNAQVEDEVISSSTSNCPTPQSLLTFVPYTCGQYGAPFCVKINVASQAEYIRVEEKLKKPRTQRPRDVYGRSSRQGVTVEEQETHDTRESLSDGQLVVMTAVLDAAGDLVELIFDRSVEIPAMLIKVIGMCVPYQQHLYKLTVLRTPLSSTVIYEFCKFLSHLTEICLDGSPLAGRTHNLLLGPATRLNYLSLARCKLDDEDCVQLAAQLASPHPAASCLHVLLLASNAIGDEGARALAHILRNNRALHYLNLADNRITDSGAISIFNVLMEFPLTKDEIKAKSYRHIKFLRRRAVQCAKFIKELTKEDKSVIDDRTTKRIKPIRGTKPVRAEVSMVDAVLQRANTLTDNLMGTFNDPFANDKTAVRGENVYCVGNMALCGLNLSYNHLHYPSIQCLWKVLRHQSRQVEAARSEPGLLRVRLDGNNLPQQCEELQRMEELLDSALARVGRLVAVAKSRGGSTKSRMTVAYKHLSP